MFAVYRFYGATNELLYVGCSANPFNRLAGHKTTRDSFPEVKKITLDWYETSDEAATKEAEGIQFESPLWNRSFCRQDVSRFTGPREPYGPRVGKERWLGVTCPRCGEYKPDTIQAYCKPCYSTYQLERKLTVGWVPVARTGLCPRCSTEPKGPNGYCRTCKKIVSAEARAKRRGVMLGDL